MNNIGRIIKHNQQAYDQIAVHFSQTRAKELWPEFQLFKKYLSSCQSGRIKILDIGCGSGRLVRLFNQFSRQVDYTGIDISQNIINQAKRDFYPRTVQNRFLEVKFKLANMLSLPFKDSVFDYVFMVASLHHLPNQQFQTQALRQAYKVLKKGGYIFITNWNLYNWPKIKYFFSLSSLKLAFGSRALKNAVIPWRQGAKTIQRIYYGFTLGELVGLVKSTGFKIKQAFYSRQGSSVHFWQGFNLVVIGEK